MRKVSVSASRKYDVIIEKGILHRAGEESAKVVHPCEAVIMTEPSAPSEPLAK